ncbi:unnamed protein product [Lactuca virosa]|uniref:Uncharacterized protein n=1 Tax=Lactuca virosa TaxID=75947 RepID=A0AAU9PIM0_9ASTR|nr:unnamed protein product [Lactuca virosa]
MSPLKVIVITIEVAAEGIPPKNEKWRLETNLKEKSEDEQKTTDEEQKASEPHTEASAEDDELLTLPMCFKRTSDEKDGGVVDGEEDDDTVNGEDHGNVRSFLP